MQDRVPLFPGRVKMTPVAGQANTFDMVRADDPTQAGTPLNKATLLKDATAALYGLGTGAVPDDVFAELGKYKQYWWRSRLSPRDMWQYLQASTRNAYPDSGTQNGYEYEYLGIPFDNAVTAPKIETGSYVGTGTSGASNPNTLTFGFIPKLVIIKPNSKTSYSHMEIVYGQGKTYTYMNNSNYGNVEISWLGNTVSWVCTSNSYDPIRGQMNEANNDYYYFAIG